ncbi:MAG: alpha/beta hydrolase [Actinomycetota bacterium]
MLDHDRPVVRWDQRGCGRSGGKQGPFTVDRFVQDLDAIRHALGISRWIVGGHSWGASLALQAVLANPATSAGLLYLSGTGTGRRWHAAYKAAPGARLTPEQLARCETLGAIETRTSAEEIEWRALRWAPDFANRARAMELAAIDAEAPWPLNRECNAAINAETTAWNEPELLSACTQITVPTLLVHGAEDPRPASAIDDLAQAIPDATVSVVDAAGHAPWLERPGAIASIIRPWLNGLD